MTLDAISELATVRGWRSRRGTRRARGLEKHWRGASKRREWLESLESRVLLSVVNDFFADRITLNGTNLTVSGSNVGATKEAGEPRHNGDDGATSVWWTWTAPADLAVQVDTEGSNFDTVLAVYTGSSVSGLYSVASDDDGGTGVTSLLSFEATAGATYQIAVDGYDSAEYGPISLGLNAFPIVDLAPDAIAGRDFYTVITNGVDPFDTSGNFTFSPASNGSYQVDGSVGPSHGTYSFVKTGPNVLRVTFENSEIGSGYIDFTFNSATGGTFWMEGLDVGGWQSGTFTIEGSGVNAAPAGSLEVSTRQEVRGWAFDPDTRGVSALVRVDVDGVLAATFAADVARADVNSVFGITGNHGFRYSLPALAEGPHTVAVYVLDTTTGAMKLLGSERVVAPSRYFDEAFYLQCNPDVAAAVSGGAVASAWDHFWANGQHEGRRANALFDEGYYRVANPDVAAAVTAGAFTSGFEHFWLNGAAENRRPCMLFDPGQYLSLNPDVAAAVQAGAIGSGYEHYFRYGQYETGRSPSVYFDTACYVSENEDVEAALQSGGIRSAVEHYVLFGMREGRKANDYFDEGYYVRHNPDVAGAVNGGAFGCGYEHYLLYGQYEPARCACVDFDAAYYLAHNPDVNAVWLAGQIDSPWEHFLMWGRNEGRVAHT